MLKFADIPGNERATMKKVLASTAALTAIFVAGCTADSEAPTTSSAVPPKTSANEWQQFSDDLYPAFEVTCLGSATCLTRYVDTMVTFTQELADMPDTPPHGSYAQYAETWSTNMEKFTVAGCTEGPNLASDQTRQCQTYGAMVDGALGRIRGTLFENLSVKP